MHYTRYQIEQTYLTSSEELNINVPLSEMGKMTDLELILTTNKYLKQLSCTTFTSEEISKFCKL